MNRLRRLVGFGAAPAGKAKQALLPGGVGLRPGALRPPVRSWLTAWARWVLAESAARR